VVAGADPVVVRGGVVGLVVGVRGRVVELAGLRVLAGGLGVEGSSGLAVKGREPEEAKYGQRSRHDATRPVMPHTPRRVRPKT